MDELTVSKLSDCFGQYLIVLTCTCGHVRQAHPHTFAAIAGWDTRLALIVKRLRCSKCGKKGTCAVRTIREQKPRGLRDER